MLLYPEQRKHKGKDSGLSRRRVFFQALLGRGVRSWDGGAEVYLVAVTQVMFREAFRL